MNLHAAPAHAREARGPRAAAKLYADIEYELAMGDPTPAQEQDGEQALRMLSARWPGVKQQSDDVVENGHTPRMSRRANNNMWAGGQSGHEGRQHGHGNDQTRPSAHARKRVASNRRRRSLRSSSGAGGGRHVPPRAAQTLWQGSGLSAGADSISLTVMKGLGLVIGLSLLYLVVKPGGSRAFTAATNTGSNLLHAFISPNVDPLQSRSAAAAGPAGAPAARPPAPQRMSAVATINQQAHLPGNSVRPIPKATLTWKPTVGVGP